MATSAKPTSWRFLFALAVFSGFVTSGFALARGTLYWDTARLFTQFRDVMQSLHDFGELPWWFPHHQQGFPGYYQWMLNTAGASSPLFVLTGFLVWLAGRIGVGLHDYQSLYVAYYAFLTPLLFLIALSRLAGRYFRGAVLTYVLTVGAFSPAVILNTSDIGFLEPCAYTLFVFAAYLDFLDEPNRVTYRRLALAALALTVGLNNAFLYWGIIAVPLFIAVTWDYPKIRRAALSVPVSYHLALAAGFVIALAPAVITYVQVPGVVRSSLGGEKSYAYSRLAAGNPLEWLTVSTPGVGFDWNTDRDRWSLLPLGADHFSAYYYLGASTLGLAFWGMLTSPYVIRLRLILLVAAMSLVVSLSGYSPLFSSVLLLKTPLRFCNHFGDVTFKAGGFLTVLFAAGFGLRSVLRSRGGARFFVLFLATGFLAVGVQWLAYGSRLGESVFFGFLLSVVILTFFLYAGFRGRDRKSVPAGMTRAWLWLVLIDLSTHAFLNARIVDRSTHSLNSGWGANVVIDQTPSASNVGLRDSAHPHYYGNHFLMLRERYDLVASGKNPEAIHFAALYRDLPPGDDFAAATRLTPVPARIRVVQVSFNEWAIDVRSPRAGYFVLRDAFFPFWRAEVNDEPAEVRRAFGLYKSVAVPAGPSRIRFRFQVPYVATFATLAYAILAGLALKVFGGGLRRFRLTSPVFETA